MQFSDSRDTERLPLLALEDPVFFPGVHMTLQLLEAQCKSCIDEAMAGNRRLFVGFRAVPGSGDLAGTGLITSILQVIKLPGGIFRLLLDPAARGVIDRQEAPRSNGLVMVAVYRPPEHHGTDKSLDFLMRTLTDQFGRYAAQHGKIPQEILQQIQNATSPHKLSDLIAGAAGFPRAAKLQILQDLDLHTRLQNLAVLLETETELLEFKKTIHHRTRQRMDKSQREYYINEQIKELQKELGGDDDSNHIREIQEAAHRLGLDARSLNQVETEIRRLSRLPPMSPEAGTLRTWLEWVISLPWNIGSATSVNLAQAQQILNEDHYDLQEAKDRILEYLAAWSFKPDLKAPILCFAGPPGTGKTSLGRSLARALGRPFHRISLGGLRDEAELRGHRRTYVGALPGKIIQGLRRLEVNNPVILLDEIDKLASDYRGDPSSALLEILDPEQNNQFTDHYLELPFNLRQVIFLASANDLSTIPAPLRDRMDVVSVPGYTRLEKTGIARNFIIPKQLGEHGLDSGAIVFPDATLDSLVKDYTREAGVRNLERSIIRIIRKCQRTALDQQPPQEHQEQTPAFPRRTIQPEDLQDLLKTPANRDQLVIPDPDPGLVYGLAWTEHGGRILPVEASVHPGKGNLNLTGKLGDVMKESAWIALSVIKALAAEKQLELDLPGKDIHIHVPEGATPKDGPSAGITLCTTLYSILTGQVVPSHIAMTGELTLTRRVLPVGGIREKVLAAQAAGFTRVILPAANRTEAAELPECATDGLELVFVSHFAEVLQAIGGIA